MLSPVSNTSIVSKKWNKSFALSNKTTTSLQAHPANRGQSFSTIRAQKSKQLHSTKDQPLLQNPEKTESKETLEELEKFKVTVVPDDQCTTEHTDSEKDNLVEGNSEGKIITSPYYYIKCYNSENDSVHSIGTKFRKILILFVNHLGCTFTKELLIDLCKRAPFIKKHLNCALVVVHMERKCVAKKVFKYYSQCYNVDIQKHLYLVEDPENNLSEKFHVKNNTKNVSNLNTMCKKLYNTRYKKISNENSTVTMENDQRRMALKNISKIMKQKPKIKLFASEMEFDETLGHEYQEKKLKKIGIVYKDRLPMFLIVSSDKVRLKLESETVSFKPDIFKLILLGEIREKYCTDVKTKKWSLLNKTRNLYRNCIDMYKSTDRDNDHDVMIPILNTKRNNNLKTEQNRKNSLTNSEPDEHQQQRIPPKSKNREKNAHPQSKPSKPTKHLTIYHIMSNKIFLAYFKYYAIQKKKYESVSFLSDIMKYKKLYSTETKKSNNNHFESYMVAMKVLEDLEHQYSLKSCISSTSITTTMENFNKNKASQDLFKPIENEIMRLLTDLLSHFRTTELYIEMQKLEKIAKTKHKKK